MLAFYFQNPHGIGVFSCFSLFWLHLLLWKSKTRTKPAVLVRVLVSHTVTSSHKQSNLPTWSKLPPKKQETVQFFRNFAWRNTWYFEFYKKRNIVYALDYLMSDIQITPADVWIFNCTIQPALNGGWWFTRMCMHCPDTLYMHSIEYYSILLCSITKDNKHQWCWACIHDL
jgi:hypothetical protein